MIDDYRQKTKGMGRSEKAEYTITYYWYHMLGIAAVLCLVVFFIVHFGFGGGEPEFTCVMVNQEINPARDKEFEARFTEYAGAGKGMVLFDSDYNISYRDEVSGRDIVLEGVNESSYEKYFFKWQNHELDAVIMPVSFYHYCKELGGEFTDLSLYSTGNLPVYEEKGKSRAVYIEETEFGEKLSNETGEKLVLAFPDTGEHPDKCQKFLDFLNQ